MKQVTGDRLQVTGKSRSAAVPGRDSFANKSPAGTRALQERPLRVDERTLAGMAEGSVVVFNNQTLQGDICATKRRAGFDGDFSGHSYTCRWLGFCELSYTLEPVEVDQAEWLIEKGLAR